MTFWNFLFLSAAFFLLGLTVGSFLNVVILRYNTGRTLSGRSSCGSCGRMLKWFELLPLASFVLQGGRCRSCRARLSWQYPLVEFAAGLIFLGVFLKLSSLCSGLGVSCLILPALYHLLLWCLFIIIFVYDLRHKIIPDPFTYSLAILSLIRLAASFLGGAPIPVSALAAGPALFVFFFLFWFFSRGRLLGLGDAKLALGIGWFLGLSGGISAVFLASWIGLAVSAVLLFWSHLGDRLPAITGLNHWRKSFTMKSEIPFGPFLVLGAALVFFFNLNIFVMLTPSYFALNYE